MNETEREAIILNSAWEMIDGLVNWAIFEKTERLSFQIFGSGRASIANCS